MKMSDGDWKPLGNSRRQGMIVMRRHRDDTVTRAEATSNWRDNRDTRELRKVMKTLVGSLE